MMRISRVIALTLSVGLVGVILTGCSEANLEQLEEAAQIITELQEQIENSEDGELEEVITQEDIEEFAEKCQELIDNSVVYSSEDGEVIKASELLEDVYDILVK